MVAIELKRDGVMRPGAQDRDNCIRAATDGADMSNNV
jgi:hypothetical protein